MRFKGRLTTMAVSTLATLSLVGGLTACANGDDQTTTATGDAESTEYDGPYRDARAANRSRLVGEQYPATPQVLADPGHSGIEISSLLFDQSDTAVVSGPGAAAQLRAASIGVVSHAPVLNAGEGNEAEVIDELIRLGTTHVLVVGDALADVNAEDIGSNTVIIRDDGSQEALSQLTAKQFSERQVGESDDAAAAVAELDAEESTLLVPSWETMDASDSSEDLQAFPAQSNRDGESAPVIIASPESGLAALATARAFGANVRFMDYPDPRLDSETMEMVAGLADQPLLALGDQFGTSERLSSVIERGETITEELPGGGGLVFPGRRMIALYGHPSGPALGLMGEQPPAEAVSRVEDYVDQYQEFSDQPVIPAFEIIATVASEFPGEDGNYTNEFPVEDLRPYVDAVTEAGGYAVLDLQPGRGTFLEQAKLYEELLKEPNVGLALDPEWKLGPDEAPMARVGSAEAAEINEVSEWLAGLVRENELPQKALILHQFQLQMLRDREQINTDHIELAFVLHADGHGSPEQKFDTWNVLREGLSPDWFMAWKNFIDEDSPTFTPEQTYETVDPRPWFVSYQ